MHRCSTTVVPYTHAKASPNSPQPSASHGLQPVLWAHAPFPETMDKRVPCCFVFPIGHLPVQDLPFATAIRPEPQRDEQHHFLAAALMTLAPSFVHLARVHLGLHTEPNAVELDHGRDIGDRFSARLPK